MSKFIDERYKLVWHDEFDGDRLDRDTWSYQRLMGATKEFKVTEDEAVGVVSVSDSMLHVYAVKCSDPENADIKYAVAPTIHTGNSMGFKYGYIEMRARVPFKHGAWPSLWLSSRNVLGSDPKAPFSAEVDIFENFGSINTLLPNIHKWYNDENGNKSGEHTQYPINKKIPFKFEDTEGLSDTFHIYGFEWTPEKIDMSVDGKVYMTFDINDNYDGRSDMSGFHSPLRIMINNHLFTESSRWLPSADCIANESDFPMEYDIDYIRLYQIPGVGEIYKK